MKMVWIPPRYGHLRFAILHEFQFVAELPATTQKKTPAKTPKSILKSSSSIPDTRAIVYNVTIRVPVTIGLTGPGLGRSLAVSCKEKRRDLRKTIKEVFGENADIGAPPEGPPHVPSTHPMYSKPGVVLSRGKRRLLGSTMSSLYSRPEFRHLGRLPYGTSPFTTRRSSSDIPYSSPYVPATSYSFTPISGHYHYPQPLPLSHRFKGAHPTALAPFEQPT